LKPGLLLGRTSPWWLAPGLRTFTFCSLPLAHAAGNKHSSRAAPVYNKLNSKVIYPKLTAVTGHGHASPLQLANPFSFYSSPEIIRLMVMMCGRFPNFCGHSIRPTASRAVIL
jgi:hypothetical protein